MSKRCARAGVTGVKALAGVTTVQLFLCGEVMDIEVATFVVGGTVFK